MHKKWFAIVLMVTMLAVMVGVTPVSAAPNTGNAVHVVQRGETLFSIARRYGVGVWTIANFNGIINPNYIYVGQRLIIPAGYHPPGPLSGTVHVVQAGEGMLQIGLRYGVDAWAIARANGITNLNYIYVGQRLIIPRPAPRPGPPPPPRPPVSWPSTWPGPWSAEYFSNATLAGAAYSTCDNESINFDWGWGAPIAGMPANRFSARWTGTFFFDAGTWRFIAKVDDGVRVYVDGALVINGWRDGGFRPYTKDLALAAGDHTIQVEYYDRSQVGRIHVWWKALSLLPCEATSPSCGTPTPPPCTSPSCIEPTPSPSGAWLGQFYNNQDVAGDPVFTLYTPRIEFDWGTESPDPGIWWDGFSARFTSRIQLESGDYYFCTMADDGVRIWIGTDLILDAWRANDGSQPVCANYSASAGEHDARVEYYENGGDALLSVWWELD